MYMDDEGMTLATEILHELKASARRWFIAFIVMLLVEVSTIVGFLWYLSLPADETITTQEIADVENSGDIVQKVGDGNVCTADSNPKKTDNPQTETEKEINGR